MSDSLLLRNLRTSAGERVDLLLVDGRIAAMAPGLAPPAGATILEGRGRLLLPAPLEPHTHLDKTLWGLPWLPNTAGDTLAGMIENERRVLAELGGPSIERSRALLRQLVAYGSLAVRSHVDVHPDVGLESLEAMLALRAELAPAVALQVVAFPQQGLLSRPGTLELMREAAKLEIDCLGGLDPAGVDGDPAGQLDFLFDLAAERGLGLDIHLHDRGTLGHWQLGEIAARSAARGLGGRVMVSHAYCLGSAGPETLKRLAGRLAESGVAIMTTAPADGPAPPVKALRTAGVTVCSGNDGIRDAWSPLSSGDQLERAWLVALRFDWATDEDLALAYDSVCGQAAAAMGLDAPTLAVGAPANLLLLPAETLGEAIVARPRDRLVVSGGRVVAEDGRCLLA